MIKDNLQPTSASRPSCHPLSASLPTVQFPVERSHALMRGFWRLLSGLIVGAAPILIRPDWPLMWNTQKAVFLSSGMLLLCAAIIAVAISFAAVRWLLLAIWLGPLCIDIDGGGVTLSLGPFGSHRYPWSDLRIQLQDGLDPEIVDLMPDDAFVPQIIHVKSSEDIALQILKFSPISHEAFTRAMRPYVNK